MLRHVENRLQIGPLFEHFKHFGFSHDAAPGRIDKSAAVLHAAEVTPPDHSNSLREQWSMQRHNVAPIEYLIEGYKTDAKIACLFFGNIGIEGEDLEIERSKQLHKRSGDNPERYQSNRAAETTHRGVPIEAWGRLPQFPHQPPTMLEGKQDHRQRIFGHGNGVGGISTGDQDASLPNA